MFTPFSHCFINSKVRTAFALVLFRIEARRRPAGSCLTKVCGSLIEPSQQHSWVMCYDI